LQPTSVTASAHWACRRCASGGSSSLGVTARGAALHLSVAQPTGVGAGRVRVVVESRQPELARASVLALGGTVERSAAGLVQALVARDSLAALRAGPGIGRIRAPYSSMETSVGGEEVA